MRTADFADAKEGLQLVGMDDGQATAYVRLSLRGPLRAAELAADLGISRQDAYRLLHAMMARGFIASDLGHPATFRASPSEEIFARALASQAARVKELSHADAAVTEALGRMQPTSEEPAGPTFRIVRGRADVLSLAARLIADARDELRMVSTHPATMSLAAVSGIQDAVAGQVRRGTRVRGIVRAGPDGPRHPDALAGLGEVRALDRDVPAGLLVADDRSLLLSIVTDPSGRLRATDDVSLWTDARHLVALQSLLFDALWEQAAPIPEGEAADAAPAAAAPESA